MKIIRFCGWHRSGTEAGSSTSMTENPGDAAVLTAPLVEPTSFKFRCLLSLSSRTMPYLCSRLWRDHIPSHLPGLWWRGAFHNNTQVCWCHLWAVYGQLGLEDCNYTGATRQEGWKACKEVPRVGELQGSDPCSNRNLCKRVTAPNPVAKRLNVSLSYGRKEKREGAGLRKLQDNNNHLCSYGGSKMWQTNLGV